MVNTRKPTTPHMIQHPAVVVAATGLPGVAEDPRQLSIEGVHLLEEPNRRNDNDNDTQRSPTSVNGGLALQA